jgi:hypothetical protein
LELLTAVAELAYRAGKNRQALVTIAFVLAQPAIGQALEDKANQLMAQINAAISPDDAATYRKQGRAMTIETLVQEIMNTLLV